MSKYINSAMTSQGFKVAGQVSATDKSTATTLVDSTGTKSYLYWFWYCPSYYYNYCCFNYWAWWRRCWFSIYAPY